jgi:hypothetical protein
MAYCNSCGLGFPSEANFCDQCGQKLSRDDEAVEEYCLLREQFLAALSEAEKQPNAGVEIHNDGKLWVCVVKQSPSGCRW